MPQTRFTKDHEWVRLDGAIATVGITDHAQQALGDIVYVELPELGEAVEAGQPCAVVESVKAASDVYAPMTGTVAERNSAVVDDPALVNREAADGAWFFKIEVQDATEFGTLLDDEGYRKLLETI